MKHDIMLDLETVVDPENPPDPPKKEGEEQFPSPIHWKIVSFGVAVIVQHRIVSLKVLQGSEREQLVKFTAAVKKEDRLLTFNGRGFDLPVINHRCFHHGLPWPWYHGALGPEPKYRYKTAAHLDVMDYLADYGGLRRAPSMGALARSIGLRGKGEVSGSDVASLYAANDQKSIDQYCLEDVAQQVAIFLRVELLRSEISLEDYQECIDRWMDVVVGVCPSLVNGVDIDKLRLNR